MEGNYKERGDSRNQESKSEYESIHKFLLFNFILANDIDAARNILKRNCGTDITLTGNDIKAYLSDVSSNILSVAPYRDLFRSCLRDMLDHRLRITRHYYFGSFNKGNFTQNERGDTDTSGYAAMLYKCLRDKSNCEHFINNYPDNPVKNDIDRINIPITLLELACVLSSKYNSTDMIDIILSMASTFKEDVLHVIVCNPSVNNDTVARLLESWPHVCRERDREVNFEVLPPIVYHDRDYREVYSDVLPPPVYRDHEYREVNSDVSPLQCRDRDYREAYNDEYNMRTSDPYDKRFHRLHVELSSSIIAYFDACQNDPEDPLCDHDKTTTLSKIKRFFRNTAKAIEVRNSCVFKVCVQNVDTKSRYVQSMAEYAIRCQAWYILHLILTNKDFENKLIWDEKWIVSSERPLFIANYLLRTFISIYRNALRQNDIVAVEAMTSSRLVRYGCISSGLLTQWLVCSYMTQVDKDALRKHSLFAMIFNFPNNQFSRDATFYIMCKLLIKLGVDIQDSRFFGKTPMSLAIEIGEMRLVRLLLYYGLSNDGSADMAFSNKEFHILKVLLLSGDRLEHNENTLKLLSKSSSNFNARKPMDRLRSREAIWVREWLTQPHSLSFYCRKGIREHYKTKLPQLLKSIAYPKKLKQYIRTEIL